LLLLKFRSTMKIFRTTIFNAFHVLLCFVYFHYFCSVSLVNASSLRWKIDTSYPFALGDAVVLSGDDHYLYVFGGRNKSTSFSRSFKLNLEDHSVRVWTPITPSPFAIRAASGCVSNDGRFFIFGGYTGTPQNSIQIYNSSSDTWNLIVPELPNGSSIMDWSMSCTVDSQSGLMYLTGGYYFGNRFYSYDPDSNILLDLSNSSPYALFGHGSFFSNGKLYVFGGAISNRYSSSGETHVFDASSKKWSFGSHMVHPASSFGYASDGSRFYVIGGYGNEESTQVYHISKKVWKLDNGLVYPEGVFCNSVAYIDGSLHSVGVFTGKYLSLHLNSSLCDVYPIESCN